MSTEQRSRVVLINGATGGLGPAVVSTFVEEGARLVLSTHNQPELDATAASLALNPDTTLLLPANATDATEVERVVQIAQERFGALDVVVQVTGGFQGGTLVAETDLKTWQLMIDLNLHAAFYTARAALPGMLKRGYGKLIFVSSRGGSQPAPGIAGYAASKGGLEMLVRVLAEETRQRGVNVNAVAPSIIDTLPNRKANPDADFATWVQPASLAGVIHFLASEMAQDIHGAVVPVYGRA